MKKYLLLLMGLSTWVLLNAQIQKENTAIVFEENFDGWSNIESEGWYTYNENTYNFINADGEAVTFFKQNAASYMMLISPEIDLTTATSLTFSHQRISSVDGIVLEVGVMTDPEDPATFTLLNVVQVNSSDWTEEGSFTVLSALTGNYHLAFNVAASSPPPYTYLGIDNVEVVDDGAASNWPSYITNFEITPLDNGVNSASLSWLNPNTEADGDDLTDLDSLVVLMNGEYKHTVYDPVIGGNVDLDLDVPEAGFYVFTVTAYNDAGSSVSIYNEPEVWIGLDTPGLPSNIQLIVENDSVSNLSWEVPTVGAHGAYFDGVVSSYKITRVDGTEFTVEGNILEFSEILEEPGTYSYFVEGVNNSGIGESAESNAGAFYFDGFLLVEDFWVSVPALGWENSGDGLDYFYHWPTDYAGSVKYWEMILHPDANNPYTGLTRIASPVVNSDGFEALILKFRHFHNWNSGNYAFRVQTTTNGTDWNTVWEISVDESLLGDVELLVLDNEDVGSSEFQFSFVFEGNSANCEFLTIDEVSLYEAAEIDIVATELMVPDLIEPGDIVSPMASIENWGYVESPFTAELVFYNNGNIVYSSEVNSTIDGGGLMDFSFDNWEATVGNYTAELVIFASGDANNDNNTITEEFNVILLDSERTLVVCEEGTGTWCGYCPGAAMGLDELIENSWPVAVIAYHSGDNYETEDGVDRLNYYNVGGYPTVYFDGVDVLVGGSASESMYNEYLPIVEDRLTIPAAVSIDIESAIFGGDHLYANIEILSSSVIEDELALVSVLTESYIPESWQNQDELNFVQRAIYGGYDGTSIDMSDQNESVVINIPLEPEWIMDNCELIVFVQNMNTKEIYNGNKINLLTVGVNDQKKWVSVYPNPASHFLNINNCSDIDVELYDLNGKQLYSQYINSESFRIDVSEFQKGVYILKLIGKDGISAQKLLLGK